MADSNDDLEKRMSDLGQFVRSEWAKRHPATEKEREAVKRALVEYWQHKRDGAETHLKEAEVDLAKEEERSKDEEQQHRHGH